MRKAPTGLILGYRFSDPCKTLGSKYARWFHSVFLKMYIAVHDKLVVGWQRLELSLHRASHWVCLGPVLVFPALHWNQL